MTDKKCLLLAGLAVAILSTPVARAEDENPDRGADNPSPAAEARLRPPVEVQLVGALGQDAVLVQLLGEWLSSSEIAHVVVRRPRLVLEDIKAPRSSGPPVRMWIAAVNDRLIRVYFAEPDAGRFLVRDAPMPSGLDELGRERLVQIVLSSVLAFTEQHTSSSLEEIERSMPPPQATVVPPKKQVARVRPTPPPEVHPHGEAIGLGVLYAASSKGGEGTAHGPGAFFELVRTFDRFTAGGRLQGQYRAPRTATTERMRLQIEEIVADAAVITEVSLSSRWWWRVEIGGGIQWVHVEPAPRTADVTALGAGWNARAVAFGVFGPAFELGNVRVGLGGRLDLQPMGTRYEVEDRGVRQTELVVPRFQPGVVLTVGFRRSISGAHAARSPQSAAQHGAEPLNR